MNRDNSPNDLLVYWRTVLDLAARLPGAEESTSYGTPALKVKGKLIARLWEDGETLVVKVDYYEREHFLASGPDVYFITDHYRDYPWILVRLPRIAADELAERLEEAWCLAAPQRLVSRFLAERGQNLTSMHDRTEAVE